MKEAERCCTHRRTVSASDQPQYRQHGESCSYTNTYRRRHLMIRKYTSLKKLALATLALGALAQPAAAFIHGDFKVYPGSLCVAQGVQPNSSISIGPEGTVFNISTTSDLSVVCPIVRDNVSQNGHPTS